MNSISLLSMDLGGVLLNVLAIIGIIIAGGFLIFFLGDLLLSILDPKNNSLNDKEKQQGYDQYNQPQRLQEPTKPQELTYIPTQPIYEQTQPVYEKPKPQEQVSPVYKEVDLVKALEEERRLFALEKENEKAEVVEPLEEINEETTTLDIFEALKKEEEAYKAEKINSTATPVFGKNEEVEEDEEEFNFDDLFFTNNDEEIEEPAPIVEEKEPEFDFDFDFNFDDEDEDEKVNVDEEELEEESVEEVEKIEEIDDEALRNLQEENENLKKEIEKLVALQAEKKQELEEERQTVETLRTKAKSETPLLTEEEYQERLEELNARLKYNEKELRSIKREYIPLRKVRSTLEKDKKKLRRKEALVAKQKILLYGVNNMSDIDAEKAKKLEEDLDLLDGLRLSVQHCEEVIRNSEERYPILETSYNILTKTIAQIKGDIEKVEASIARLKK